MAIFPKVDIDPNFAAHISLRVQNPEILDTMHGLAESRVYPYSLMHRAVTLAAEPALENEALEGAVTTGVLVYEAIAGNYLETSTYATEPLRTLAALAPMMFVNDIHNADDFLQRIHMARARMEQDTPTLAEAVSDATSRYVGNDKVAHIFAIGAAGVMRSMQIFIDKRAETLEDTAS